MNQDIEEVKRELVEIIIRHLRENKIDILTAQKLAQDFLAAISRDDQKDLLTKLKELGGRYKEAEELYVVELEKIETQEKNEALSKMRDYIEKGQVEEAIKIAKKNNISF